MLIHKRPALKLWRSSLTKPVMTKRLYKHTRDAMMAPEASPAIAKELKWTSPTPNFTKPAFKRLEESKEADAATPR